MVDSYVKSWEKSKSLGKAGFPSLFDFRDDKGYFTSRLQLVVYGSFHDEGYIVLWACSHLNLKFKCEQAHNTM
jgi:hypothetical protein